MCWGKGRQAGAHLDGHGLADVEGGGVGAEARGVDVGIHEIEIEHKMADTAVVAKPMAALTPDKKKKKRKSTSSTTDTPTKSASNGASSSASPSSGKKSKKKEKKAESSNKDVMELEEPASKPKRKFDEQTKPTAKGKEKAHKSGNDEASLATDRRKRQRLSITSEKIRPAVAPSLGAISISTFNLIPIYSAICRSIFQNTILIIVFVGGNLILIYAGVAFFYFINYFSFGPGAACFPNAPPPLASLHNKEGGIAFGMWENKGITRTKKMLVAETDKMLYLGQPVVRNPSKYCHPALPTALLFFLPLTRLPRVSCRWPCRVVSCDVVRCRQILHHGGGQDHQQGHNGAHRQLLPHAAADQGLHPDAPHRRTLRPLLPLRSSLARVATSIDVAVPFPPSSLPPSLSFTTTIVVIIVQAEDDERSFGDQRRSLIERFGSKKKRSQVHSTLANKIVTGTAPAPRGTCLGACLTTLPPRVCRERHRFGVARGRHHVQPRREGRPEGDLRWPDQHGGMPAPPKTCCSR